MLFLKKSLEMPLIKVTVEQAKVSMPQPSVVDESL